MTEPAVRYGLTELRAVFSQLDSAPDPNDADFTANDRFRVIGLLAFSTPSGNARPSLDCAYEIKLIVPRGFPNNLPRIYSTDGKVAKDYHTNPAGDFCLGHPLELHKILRETPTLLGFVTGTVVPYLYRHRYTVVHGGDGPPGWPGLDHGSAGLLDYYGETLGVCNYGACLALLRQAGARQQKIGRQVKCPCGSGQMLRDCHYERMAKLRSSVGRMAIRQAFMDLRKYGPPKS